MLVPLGIWTLPARSGWDDLDSGLVTRRSARSPVTNRAAGVLLCSLTAPCGPFPPKVSGRTGRVFVLAAGCHADERRRVAELVQHHPVACRDAVLVPQR